MYRGYVGFQIPYLSGETENRAFVDNQGKQTHTKRLSEAEMCIFQLNNMADEEKEKMPNVEI